MKSKSPTRQAPPCDFSLNDRGPTPRHSVIRRALACLSIVLFWGAAGCEKEHPTAEIGSPAEMGAKLNSSLPKGTPLQTAKDFMLKEGFSCEPRTDAKWKGKAHVSYLHCKREDGIPPIKRLWEAAVIHDGSAVLAVDLRSALIYP